MIDHAPAKMRKHQSAKGRWAFGAGLLVVAAGSLVWWRWHTAPRALVRPAAVPAVEQRLIAAVARQPGSAPAHGALGRYYLQAGQPFEAVWELDQAAHLAPLDRDTRVDLATALAMGHLYPEAEAELKAAVRPPPSRSGRRELAALYLAVARPEAAVTVLREAPDLSHWPDGQLLLGRAYEGLGQPAPAREAYERSIRLAPDRVEGPFRLAHLLLTSGDPRGARSVLMPALRQWPHEARLMQLMAMTYSARWGDQEQPDREGQWLTDAAKNSGGTVPAQLALGELYLRHGRYKQGGSELERLLENADLPAAHRGMALALDHLGQPVEASYHRGMADVFDGRTDEALREFRAMAARAPDDRRVPQLISQAYAQMNELNTALKATKPFYERGDHSPELYERLATLYFVTYDRRADRRLCEEWRRAQPDSGKPLAFLGKISMADLRLSEAVNDYQQAVDKDPNDIQALLGLVDALSQQPSPENTRREVALLQQAVALAPHSAAAHYQLGIRLQQARQWEAARRELLRALDESPTMAAADNNLLQVATALRQPALARRFGSLLRAVQARQREQDAAWHQRWARPSDPEVYLALALVEIRAGHLGSAEQQLHRGLELRPAWPEAARLAARVRHLLDGVDTDGRRLIQFPEAVVTAETRRTQR